MSNKIPKYSIRLVGLLIIFISIMTWFYPFSIFSIHKIYSFTTDPIIVDQYVRELEEFTTTFEKDLTKSFNEGPIDLTVDRTRSLVPIFEQEWLTSKDSIKMDFDMLSDNLFKVKSARETLFELVVSEEYNHEQRGYLVGSIDSLLLLEEKIKELKKNTFDSRSTLNRQFRNLHVSFINNMMIYEIFYEQVQGYK